MVRANDDAIITLERWGGWVVGANDDGIMKVIKIAAARRQKNMFLTQFVHENHLFFGDDSK